MSVMTDTVSSAIAFITTLISLLNPDKSSNISLRLPPLPPINTWLGASSPARAFGASPFTMSRLLSPAFIAFSCMREHASSSRSIEYTLICLSIRAHSTDTEPVPAPTSQTTASWVSFNLHSERLLTSSFVIGTFPLINALSLSPGVIILP